MRQRGSPTASVLNDIYSDNGAKVGCHARPKAHWFDWNQSIIGYVHLLCACVRSRNGCHCAQQCCRRPEEGTYDASFDSYRINKLETSAQLEKRITPSLHFGRDRAFCIVPSLNSLRAFFSARIFCRRKKFATFKLRFSLEITQAYFAVSSEVSNNNFKDQLAPSFCTNFCKYFVGDLEKFFMFVRMFGIFRFLLNPSFYFVH